MNGEQREQLEQLLGKTGMPYKSIVKNMWAIDDPNDNLPGITISVEPSQKQGQELIKFVTFICDVPHGAKPEFYQEFLKLNFLVDHGAFAMETKSEMCFIDTLELENLDENEFTATLKAMLNAPQMFQDKYDIDIYTMGKPQF